MFDILVHFLIVTDLDYSKLRKHNPAERHDPEQSLSLPVRTNIFPRAGKPNVKPTVLEI